MAKMKTKRYEGTPIKKGFGNSKGARPRDPDWRDNVEMGTTQDGEFIQLRPVGDIFTYAQHWVEFTKRDKTKGRFPVTCRNYNSDTESFDSSRGCPCCKRSIKARIMTNSNFIVRELQEDKPAKAKIEVDAFPGQTFEGRVEFIGAAAISEFALLPTENPSGTFIKITHRIPVRISVQDPQNRLRPGMMVVVDIEGKS